MLKFLLLIYEILTGDGKSNILLNNETLRNGFRNVSQSKTQKAEGSMRFIFGKQDLRTIERSRENLFMLTNGLGGYVSVSAGYGVPRCDQGLLVAAVKAPNVRITMIHRMAESVTIGDKRYWLSTQEFADANPAEDGYRHLASFTYDDTPTWTYEVRGVRVTRRVTCAYGENTSAILYTVENLSGEEVKLEIGRAHV